MNLSSWAYLYVIQFAVGLYVLEELMFIQFALHLGWGENIILHKMGCAY